MQQNLTLNIIPFTPNKTKLSFAFYPVKEKSMAPIHWGKLFETFPEGIEGAIVTEYMPTRGLTGRERKLKIP
jgi:hypothetical protein